MCVYNDKSTDSNEKKCLPDWIDIFNKTTFKESYNICPGMLCPVIILNKHLNQINSQITNRVICPMRWGLIPNWYKGDAKSFNLLTVNARGENMETKPCFRNSIECGRRCVILSQGFYEWEKRNKQPYFIYSQDDVKHNFDKIIKIAGIFDKFKNETDDEIIYSFCIVTVDSKESPISWLHDRMPLILENESEVNMWLEFNEFQFDKVKKELFKPAQSIVYHAVSKEMNSTKYDKPENIKEIILTDSLKSQPSIKTFFKKQPKLNERETKKRSRSRSPI
jgi:putative SOS response-associated peptidase YedK